VQDVTYLLWWRLADPADNAPTLVFWTVGDTSDAWAVANRAERRVTAVLRYLEDTQRRR
jgi:hypothetical protein